MTSVAETNEKIAVMLDLLEAYAARGRECPPSRSLASLRKACQAACAANAAARPCLRTVHHFARTGGTLISRAITSLANTITLSEVNPFSTLKRNSIQFAPSDLIMLSRAGPRQLSDDLLGNVFLSALDRLCRDVLRQGQYLVLRDHTHSHFCVSEAVENRPTLHAFLRDRFALKSLVTVRHPLDSYLSLHYRKWKHFSPTTLEEYAKRYVAFLDSYAGLPIYKYEDFVTDPDAELGKMASTLGLTFHKNWQDILPAVKLAGDSGQIHSAIVRHSGRRVIPLEVAAEEDCSPTYGVLCRRLGYNPNFATV